MAGVLYTYPENFRAYKALIAAEFSGKKIKVAENFIFGESNKSVEFLKKFPTGKVPAFETSDGKYLSESNAIAYYLSDEKLKGNDAFNQAKILQWINFADSEILPASCAWVFPLLGIMAYNKNAVNRAKDDIKLALDIMNNTLLHKTFLVGERISLADIVVFCTLLHLYQYVMEPSFRCSFVCVTRWFTTILNQVQVKKIVGDFKICSQALQYDPKKFTEFQNKTSGKDINKNEKKDKSSKIDNVKNEELDPTEEALAAEPKSTNPFDNLPKGTFIMDDFKRFYSNEDESKSIPYFWQKFDPENYSIWFGKYKYNDELTKTFMSCNLITGMFQRIEKMRKQTFASVCLFGGDNNSTISGIWVWRGHDLAFKLAPDWQVDYDCYDWKKLDPKLEETKKLVEQYFSWTGTDENGLKFNQGKIFK